MKIMKIRGWRRLVDDRGEIKKIIEKANTHSGLWCQEINKFMQYTVFAVTLQKETGIIEGN